MGKQDWKRAKEAQGEQMDQGCSRGNGTQELTNNVRKGLVNTLSHWEKNKQQAQRGLTGLS